MSISLDKAKALGIDLSALGITPKRPKRKKAPIVRRPINPGELVLALDVSSSATGFAVLEATDGLPKLIAWHRFVPPPKLEMLARCDKTAVSVAHAIRALPDRPTIAIIEWADGIRWTSKRRGKSWSMNVVPLIAAQATVRAAVCQLIPEVETVTSSEWTGKIPKDKRAQQIRRIYPQLTESRDPGYDIADAVELGKWRIER